ncbi:MAG TPA: hypothetical protein VEF89_25305 [Solirubrobacteraceae bacterium]|nr:hypothetical protein [Solirubrobacteraceae bacterium]
MLDLVTVRRRMGEAAAAILAIDGASTELRPGWWLALSGFPSADLNVALIHEDDGRALSSALKSIEERGCPTLLMFAGAGTRLAGGLPSGWSAVGAMPIGSRSGRICRRRRSPRETRGAR